MRAPNVLQHQYAILKGKEACTFLSTKGVWVCTVWYGWDPVNKIAFLCHFDSPQSAASLPEIIKELKLVVPTNAKFESTLIGGKGWLWFWSRKTRKKIKNLVQEQTDIEINIENGVYDNWPWAKRGVTICAKSGTVFNEKLLGNSKPKGFCWFFKKMEKIEVPGYKTQL